MNSTTKQKVFSIFIVLISLIITIGCLEILIGFTDMDIKSLYSSFYAVEGDFHYDDGKELYRDSLDTERLYELIPDSYAVCRHSRHPLDTNQKPCKFYINKLGMRDIPGKKRDKNKRERVFRIIVLGGSNTFGVSVSNEESYPALLEKYLEEKCPGKFEVWNAGLSAYVLSQKIVYARYIIEEFNPDLLIFQLDNVGRRAFFYKGKLEYFFKRNKELFIEHIPLLFVDDGNKRIISFHWFLIKHLKSYRFLISVFNNRMIRDYRNEHTLWINNPKAVKLARYYQFYGDIISQRKYNQFISDEKTKMVLLNVAYDVNLKYGDKTPRINLNFERKSEEYEDNHPPSYVYSWYAVKIAKELFSRNILPNN